MTRRGSNITLALTFLLLSSIICDKLIEKPAIKKNPKSDFGNIKLPFIETSPSSLFENGKITLEGMKFMLIFS